jgi:hypothetical protein
LKAKPEFSLGVLKKYVATQDSEVLNVIYSHYKDKLTTKPAPEIRVGVGEILSTTMRAIGLSWPML